MKKLCAILLVVSLFLGIAGCGVSKSDYDALLATNTELESKISNLEDDNKSIHSAYDELLTERDELADKNEELQSSLDEAKTLMQETAEIVQKYTQQNNEELDKSIKLLSYITFANLVSDYAECNIINENTVLITIPLKNKTKQQIKNSVETYAFSITSNINSGKDFKSCIVLVTDNDGACLWGYTFTPGNNVSAFISDLYKD